MRNRGQDKNGQTLEGGANIWPFVFSCGLFFFGIGRILDGFNTVNNGLYTTLYDKHNASTYHLNEMAEFLCTNDAITHQLSFRKRHL